MIYDKPLMGSVAYRNEWTLASIKIRRLRQPGIGWSFREAMEDAKKQFDLSWECPAYSIDNCHNTAVGCVELHMRDWAEDRGTNDYGSREIFDI